MAERWKKAEKLRQEMQNCIRLKEYEFRDLYPVGAIVTVEVGRSRFRAEVVKHSNFQTFGMTVRNVVTGKLREIGFADLRD